MPSGSPARDHDGRPDDVEAGEQMEEGPVVKTDFVNAFVDSWCA